MTSSKQSLMLKFKGPSSVDKRRSEIRSWLGDDLVDFQPLFPDEDDVELATIFEVTLKEAVCPDVAIQKLQSHECVEYAHRSAERKPIVGEPNSDDTQTT